MAETTTSKDASAGGGNSSSSINPAAEAGFRNATAYDAYRPSYPAAAADDFLTRLGVAGMPGANVIEIAAGTGKFTEQLGRRPERFAVRAVEPHDGMRARLEDKVRADKDLVGVQVLPGKAEKMPVEDEWGDACIAAQAFHWFATVEALSEIHRALKPGARFGMIWNVEDYNKPLSWTATTEWEQKLNDYINSLKDGNPRFRDLAWKDVFEKQLPYTPLAVLKNTITDRLPRFSLPIGEQRTSWTVWLSKEALWARLQTLSQIAVLEGDGLARAKAVFEDALAGADVERNDKGEIALHGVTYFAWTDRL